MTQSIGTCIWFNNNAKEAADLYASIFPGFKSISENPLAVVYELYGRRFMNLNGGPGYQVNPSISFMFGADDVQEIDELWQKLSDGGKVMMPLNTYPWAAKYGWCADKFGVNWQLMLGHQSAYKIMPHMMFTQHNSGKAGEAINFYTSIFGNASIVAVSKYEKGEPDVEGYIKYSQFELEGLPFGAMDSSGPHPFVFGEGVSFIITVETQEEIDHYWNSLLEGGQPGKCGWLKDKYGVSWQVIPSVLGKLMTNKETAPKATYAFLQMSKFIIADLLKAVE